MVTRDRIKLGFGALVAMLYWIFFARIWRRKKGCRIWPGAIFLSYGNPSGFGPRFKFYFEKLFVLKFTCTALLRGLDEVNVGGGGWSKTT
jgi:hypothetical protein